MEKFSKNIKLNGVLNDILDSLQEFGIENIRYYYNNFKDLTDYNIVQYGNLLIYYDDIKDMYKKNGYKSIDKMSNEKVWNIYKRQVGYVSSYLLGV